VLTYLAASPLLHGLSFVAVTNSQVDFKEQRKHRVTVAMALVLSRRKRENFSILCPLLGEDET
jgi:hypothetical protein